MTGRKCATPRAILAGTFVRNRAASLDGVRALGIMTVPICLTVDRSEALD